MDNIKVFGHLVRLNDHTPAHRALSQVAAARTGSRSGPGWRRRPGRPRHSWIQQIGDGTAFSIRAERSWPLWLDATDLCCLRDLMMMMMWTGLTPEKQYDQQLTEIIGDASNPRNEDVAKEQNRAYILRREHSAPDLHHAVIRHLVQSLV